MPPDRDSRPSGYCPIDPVRESRSSGAIRSEGAAEVEKIDDFGYGLRVCRDRLLSGQQPPLRAKWVLLVSRHSEAVY